MTAFDVVLLVVVLAYGLGGYWQGFVAGASSTVGLLLGGALGIAVVPAALGSLDQTVGTALVAIVLVLLLATLGQTAGALLGARLRSRITWHPARSVDALGGAVLSMAAVLVVVWALGYAVSGARIPVVSDAVRSSAVLARVDGVMPDGADSVLDSFDGVVDSSLFPRYLEPFVSEDIVPVAEPDEKVLARSSVQRASRSVVKIVGEAEQCGRGIEGSGFVYAEDRVMTNAHVVAGVSSPQITLGDETYAATTVVFDPDLDVAVLAVPGLDATPLPFDTRGGAGDDAVVMGFPQNGPFDARAARIRNSQRLRSPDIYGDGSVTRDVFSIRSLVRSGNSGGPLVSRRGQVFGVVFAASITDPATGYVVTADQVAADAAAGVDASSEVDTGDCT